jgi:hypothetical protein
MWTDLVECFNSVSALVITIPPFTSLEGSFAKDGFPVTPRLPDNASPVRRRREAERKSRQHKTFGLQKSRMVGSTSCFMDFARHYHRHFAGELR